MDSEGSGLLWLFGTFVFPILLKYGPELWSNFGPSQWNVAAEKRLLQQALQSALSVIDGEEEGELSDDDKDRRRSLEELEDIALDADDLADELMGRAGPEAAEDEGSAGAGAACSRKRKWVRDLLKSPVLCSKIRKVREELDGARTKHGDFVHPQGGAGGATGRALLSSRESQQSNPSLLGIDPRNLLLREAEKQKLVDFLKLADPGAGNGVVVIPIVATTGCGKTTFAQAVFEDAQVKGHFPLRMWIWMSKDVGEEGEFFQVFTAARDNTSVEEQLNLQQLNQKLKKKRYLLVLDDMWDRHISNWDDVYSHLSAGDTGSRVIITTQNTKVAKVKGTENSMHYDLRGPSGLLFWKLFKSCAFGGADVVHNCNLLIGWEIAQKWRASPLAVSRLGRFLRHRNDWEGIARQELWELENRYKLNIFRVIRLRYYDLPPHLKKCFKFLSIYPMGYKFTKVELIRIWMAEGFVQASEGTELEAAAGDLFDDLLTRSFFECVGIKKDGEQNMYMLHDLIHQLALYVADDKYSRVRRHQDVLERARHASLFHSELMRFDLRSDVLYRAKGLRTLVLQGDNLACINSLPQGLFNKLEFIRVLDFSNTGVRDLPDTIENLNHLRYLSLHNTPVQRLPECLSSLYNLQTLDLSECCRLEKLPLGINQLKSLRHLELRVSNGRLSCLTSMPPGLGKLTSLRTLSRFLVGTSAGCGMGELDGMKNIVELCIEIPRVDRWERFRNANLDRKEYLSKLELHLCGNGSQILENLQPPFYIESIKIKDYDGENYPNWVFSASFSNLTEIQLENFGECSVLPSLGHLRCLKKLHISGMKKVKCIGPEFYGNGALQKFPSFPYLEKLELNNMLDLEGWPDINKGAFSGLCELHIRGCPSMTTLPNFPKLEKLTIECCQGMTSLPRFSSIDVLELRDCPEKILDSVFHLSSLSSLQIISFSALRDIPLGMIKADGKNESSASQQRRGLSNVSSLRHLEISHCSELQRLPDQLLAGLQNLQIRSCVKLRISSEVLQELSSRCYVEIHGCPSLPSVQSLIA